MKRPFATMIDTPPRALGGRSRNEERSGMGPRAMSVNAAIICLAILLASCSSTSETSTPSVPVSAARTTSGGHQNSIATSQSGLRTLRSPRTLRAPRNGLRAPPAPFTLAPTVNTPATPVSAGSPGLPTGSAGGSAGAPGLPSNGGSAGGPGLPGNSPNAASSPATSPAAIHTSNGTFDPLTGTWTWH